MEDRIGSPVRFSEIQDMRNCMTTCNLSVIKTVGRQFTWSNKQGGIHKVFTRIDRVLANTQWEDLFPTTEASFLPEGDFDHCPMILSCYRDSTQKRPFRFQNMCVTAEGFLPIIRSNWEKTVRGCHMFRLVQRLKWIKDDLKLLNQ